MSFFFEKKYLKLATGKVLRIVLNFIIIVKKIVNNWVCFHVSMH